jgi:hypothetical protein
MIGQPASPAAGAASVADATGGAPPGDGPESSAERSISDEALMGRLAAGEREALEPLYQRHARVVYSLAAQTLGPAAAEEIVQEVFLLTDRIYAPHRPRSPGARPTQRLNAALRRRAPVHGARAR